MTRVELAASRALHARRYSVARGQLATARERAHRGGTVTAREARLIHRLEARVRSEKALIEKRDGQLALAGASGVKPGTLWLPNAKRYRGRDAGVFVPGAGPKICWHTTEGSSIDGAIGAYVATGSWPHITFDPRTGQTVQHVALNRAARALEHPAGVETNRAHVIQVELIGEASETPKWTFPQYKRIASLARKLEAATGTPRKAMASFSATPRRLPPGVWLHGAGHCGHQHVPGNHHWDPGAFRIDLVV